MATYKNDPQGLSLKGLLITGTLTDRSGQRKASLI